MSTPTTPQELAEQVEALVSAYVAEGHRIAQQALERAFSTAPASPRPSSKPSKPRSKRTPSKPRSKRTLSKYRSSEEIAKIGEALYAAVCEEPGRPMVALSTKIGISVADLQRPMTRLKQGGRVRSVGQRAHTRYYPGLAEADAEARSACA